MNTTNARILLCDDHALLRAGLHQLIVSQPDMEVCGEAADTHQAIHSAAELAPDIAIVDLSMPGGGGILAIESIRKVSSSTRIIVLTMHDDPAFARTAMVAGAMAYVTKGSADTALIAAIRSVVHGRPYVDSAVAAAALYTPSGSSPARDEASPLERLTAREREVLLLLAQGYTNQQIASRLFISVKTAETHRARMARKFGFKDRSDFVRFAVEHRLLPTGQPLNDQLQ